MNYISVREFAKKNGISERTVRHYCSKGIIDGVFLTGKTWNIPEDAVLKEKKKSKASPLLVRLMQEMYSKYKGGIYHRTQIDLTYNSNRIEGSRLSQEQTRFIFETNTIGLTTETINVDDIIETTNHFRCIDFIIENAQSKLTETFIRQLHLYLKSGTSDSNKKWFEVGAYKKLPNEVGGNETCPPEHVSERMKLLIQDYSKIKTKTLKDIIEFHYQFEIIHPFQDGNGRVGRLIMFKECLANSIVPFIIEDEIKLFYYRGLQEWPRVEEYLMDTCLSAQDKFWDVMSYFRIEGK